MEGRVVEGDVASGRFGLPYAAALSLLAFSGVVGSYLADSELTSVDRAAVFAGIAGCFAAIGLIVGGDSAISRSRLTSSWSAFMVWALLSAAVSGRVWAAVVGEVGNMLGWCLLAAMTGVALAAQRYAPDVRRVLVACGWYVLLGESALLFYQRVTSGASPARSRTRRTLEKRCFSCSRGPS